MDLRDDRRGQSIQIGAIILFGTLIILLSTYQAFVVPDQNRGVEFSHSQTVQNDMQDVRNTLVSMPDGGGSRSVSVELGTRYPDRAVFVNPGPPSGSLRTIGTEDPVISVSIANAAATGDAGDFWNGDPVNYSSGALVYKPNYNVYDNPPTTVYDNTVLYNEFRSGNTTVARQNLIDGDRINLIALNGSLSESQAGAVSLDIQAASSSRNSVQITNSSNDELEISIPTRIGVERWKELLDAESVGNGGNVDVQNITSKSLSAEFRLLTIPLEENDYTLRAARAGTGSNVGDRQPAYLVKTRGDGATVTEGQSTTLEVEIRDEFNNPVSSVEVNATAESGSIDSEETTDENGQATFEYTAPTGTSGETSVNASFESTPGSDFNESTPENVTFDLTIQQSGSGNGSASSYNIDWTRPPFSTQAVSQLLNNSTQPDVRDSIADGTLLEARTTDGGDPVAQADIDYGVGSPSNATFTPSEGETDADGRNETNLVRHQDGVTKIYAASGGASDKTTVTADRLLYESFEADENALVSNGWYYNTSNGEGNAGIRNSGAVAGSRVAYINGSGGASAGDRAIELNYTLDTGNYDSLTLTYVAIEPGNEPEENLRVQYKASDGSWVTVDNVSSQEIGDWYQYRRVTLDGVDNASHNGFDLRFRQGETTTDDEWQIDAIDLVGVNESVESDLNQAPVPAFRYSPDSPDTDQTVNFDANRSDDPDGNITSYEWEFGNGETGTGEENSTEYASAGTYDVTLTVTDEGGETSTTTQNVVVSMNSNQPPSASFTASPDPAQTGESISLDASGSNDPDGSISNYEWDFDDDGQYDDATGSSTSTTYNTAGDKTISLRVTDNDGATSTTSETVTVVEDVQSGTASGPLDSGDPGQGPTQTQTFTVTLGDDLSAGDDITIEVSDPGGGASISYSNPSTTSPGTVSVSGSTITYSPGGSESNGDTISIDIDASPDNNAGGNSYTVTFTGTDSSSATDTFNVN